MTTLNDFHDEEYDAPDWNDPEHTVHYRQVVGNSGVYLIVTDPDTGEVLRDDRPWQMREGVS